MYQYVDTTGALKTTADQTQTPGIAANSGIQTINSSTFTPTPTPTIPPYTPTQTPTLDSLAGQSYAPTTSEPTTGATSDILSRIKGLYDTQGTKSQVQASLETGAGIPDLQKQLNEINAQIGSYTAQAKQFQMNQEDRNAPMFAITGSQAAAERQLSAKTFGLAAAAQALQGNIALAKDNVQRALSAEFDPLESQIKYQEQLLSVNQANLSKQDAAKAKQAELDLQDKKDALAQAKDEKANIYNLVLDAGQNHAPNSVLQAIQSAPDYATALRIASQAGVLAAPVKATTSPSEKQPSVSEIQQYQIDYPDADIKFGDSLATIQQKINPNAPTNFAGTTFSGLVATMPDGSKLTFPNNSALEQFKKDNGLVDTQAATEASAPSFDPNSPIEKKITNLKRTFSSKTDIAAELHRQGFSWSEINNSSAAGVSSAISSITSKLFMER